MRYPCFVSSLALGISVAMSIGPSALGQNYILANDRLTVIPPSGEMELGTANDVKLHISYDAVLQVIVRWKSLDGDLVPEDAHEEKQGIMIFGTDGNGVLSVHPPALGTSAMSVEVDFQDARYAVSTTVVNVGLPKRKPKTFELSDGTSAGGALLHMDLGSRKSVRLRGIATYSGYKFPVDVHASKLNFAAEQPQSPIELDPGTGIVIAHSYGTAIVRAKLGGRESDVCVVVSKDAEDVGSAKCSR
jgi:hypothetical protein